MATDEPKLLSEPGAVAKALQSDLAIRARTGMVLAHRSIELLTEALVIAAVVTQVGMLFTNVVARRFFHYDIPWTLEIAQLTLVIQAFMGASLAYWRDKHIAVEALVSRLPTRWQQFVHALATWFVLGIAVWICKLTFPLVTEDWTHLTPILQIPETSLVLPVTVGMGLVGVYAVAKLVSQHGKGAIYPGALFLAVVIAAVSTHHGASAWDPESGALFLMLGVTCVLILLGVPIAFALAAASFSHLYLSSTAPVTTVVLNMQLGVNSYALLAVPLFIGAGLVMAHGGLSEPLIDFLSSLLGRIRGGMHHVLIVAMFIFSGLSGSKIADVAGVGTPLKVGLSRLGYDPADSAALTAAAAAGGETIPPSVAMIVLGSITSLSISKLFIAGILPAVLISALLMIVVGFLAPGERVVRQVTLRTRAILGIKAIPALTVPVFLIAGVLSGVATPTEIGSVAVVYGLALAAFLYRQMSVRKFLRIMSDTAATTGMVLFLVSGATAFSWSLVVAQVPARLASFVSSIGNGYVFMMFTLVALVVLGSILEGLAAILIFGPLLLPFAYTFNIDPIHYSIVFLLGLGVGVFTPPVGVGLFTACAVFDTTMEKAFRRALCYLGVVLAGAAIIAFVPWFTAPHF